MLLGAGAFCSASQQEEFNLLAVPQLKSENVVAFKESLASQMSRVRMTKYLVYGALAFGTFEMIRRSFFSEDTSPVTQKDHAELAKKVGDVEKFKGRIDALERNAHIPGIQTQWLPWITDKVTSAGQKVGEWLPSIVKAYLYSQAGSVVLRHVPQIDGYIALNPTINWCMLSGTPFIDAIGSFMGWFQALQLEPGKYLDPHNPDAPLKNLDKRSLAISCHDLVSAMEQVLGYMDYVTESLNPKDEKYLIQKSRAEICRETIATEMKAFIVMMNAFLQEESITAEIFDGMMSFWHAKMFLIVQQLENFEPVTIAAGFKERDGKGNFNLIKKYLLPNLERKPEPAPTVGPLQQLGGDIIGQVAQTVFS